MCIPLWCAADHSHEEGGETSSATPLRSRPDRPRTSRKKAHSRVVRISPGDSVVLNSAERAPFLLHVEVLEGDLDFDPTRRENRELLKKIVIQEDMKRRKAENVASANLGTNPPFRNRQLMLAEGFGRPMPDVVPPTPERNRFGRRPERAESIPGTTSTTTTATTNSRKDAKPDEVEEMDLVEQLYGAKLSVRDMLPDLSDSVPLPSSAPKNKQTDLAAWDRMGSEMGSRRPSFGTPNLASFSPDTPIHALSTSPANGYLDTPDSAGLISSSPEALTSPKRIITLEDYSERMRTAAVMLAQLNASLVPTVPDPSGHSQSATSSSSGGGALSWIPGTGWITKSKDLQNSSSSSSGPGVDPSSAGGKLKLAAAQAAAIRQRIMEEMISLEEERVERMTERPEGVAIEEGKEGEGKTVEDEGIVRRELNKADPSGGSGPSVWVFLVLINGLGSAAVFKESWTAKKSRIRAASPWGHLANWDVSAVSPVDVSPVEAVV